MAIHIDHQVVTESCASCSTEFQVVRGSVYESGVPFAIYLIALHGHSRRGSLAHLAIGLKEEADSGTSAAALDVAASSGQFEFSVVDWAESPWAGETYLGRMLDRSSVLEGPMRGRFFEVAGEVVRSLPEVQAYFG